VNSLARERDGVISFEVGFKPQYLLDLLMQVIVFDASDLVMW
jgi:hypothetical protein